MEKIIANKKPNNQVFIKFESEKDFLDNKDKIAWNGEIHTSREKYNNTLQIQSYEGWTDFDPKEHYLTNSDFECYYPVSKEYFEKNYIEGEL